MKKWFFIIIQYGIPQHWLSVCFGKFANNKQIRVKNWAINRFIKRYQVDLQDAEFNRAEDYASFNDFFIRKLKSGARPIANDRNVLACPTDGSIAEIGTINRNQLIQAKGHYFTLEALLGDDHDVAQSFLNGRFATLYLAPHNYHRVHMPMDGELVKTIYIPGKLFSVNIATANNIPNLYARNERLICLFNTAAGPMAVILVGAMIVGSMQTVWMDEPIRTNKLISETKTTRLSFKKGDELGYFKLGSTVILLFANNMVKWLPELKTGIEVQVGQPLAMLE